MKNGTHVASGEQRLSLKTYISYGIGDTGDNICFSTISSLITLFYTDYIGISPATVALVMLVSRCLDGVSDFIAGLCMQRTKSKWGMCRPWILWSSVPFSIACVACYAVPQGSPTLQFWYIFISYNFMTTVCYTFSNLAQATLCSLMSRDAKERERLGTWRIGLAPIGHILSAGLSLPMVQMLGDNQAAWIKVMAIWAVYALVAHLVCFANCPERVQIKARDNTKRPPLPQQLKALFTNQYWWWSLAFWLFWATSFGVSGTTMSYYTRYILQDDTLYSTFFILEKVVWCVGMLVLVPFFRRVGLTKVHLLVIGSAFAIGGHALLLVSPYSVPVNYITVILRGLAVAPSSALFNGMVADVVEYGQWKTHQRQESLIFSASSVGQKAGGGLLLASITAILGMSGFISSTTGGAAQPDAALITIKNLYIWAPIIIFGALGVTSMFYRLDKKLSGIIKELNEREARGEL